MIPGSFPERDVNTQNDDYDDDERRTETVRRSAMNENRI